MLACAGVVGLVALLLFTGGSGEQAKNQDGAGDVKVGKGPQAPEEIELADIERVNASLNDGTLRLEARMGAPLIRKSPQRSETWRWEVFEDGEMTWIVSAVIDIAPNVSVIATQRDYSASTVNDSLWFFFLLNFQKMTVYRP